ncbi:MAG: cell envelope integrity protein CreD [Pseudomonadota bacterium]
MQLSIPRVGRSASIKAMTIALLILVLLIPMSMIKDVVRDRNQVHEHARGDIKRSWGFEQLIAGPVLVVPYSVRSKNAQGQDRVDTRRAYILPTELDIAAETAPEIRRRGLHKVPIYTASVTLRGSFPRPDVQSLNLGYGVPDWSKAFVALSISDARAIAETPSVTLGKRSSRFAASGMQLLGGLAAPIVALSGQPFEDGKDSVDFAIDLRVKGSDALRFLPLADTTLVTMTSTWANPSFVGNHLPETREISASGFTAEWRIAGLGRSLPSQWTDGSQSGGNFSPQAFGVTFYMPVSLYQVTLRASKYAVLFIGLSFVAYFLFEILGDLRLHPLQYLLVGFANALFYLLLLSLAEHMGFGGAYFLSATASTTLISGYSAAVLRGRRPGLIMAVVLGLLYAFLYMTLKAENFALLVGSIGLWAALAAVMYATRKIDWYAYSNPKPAADSGETSSA